MSDEDIIINDSDEESEDGSDSRTVILVTDQETKDGICFNFTHEGTTLVASFFISGEFDIDAINAFNLNSFYAAAAIDDDGDLVIRAAICLKGGISEKTLKNFIEHFSDEMGSISDYIGEEEDE